MFYRVHTDGTRNDAGLGSLFGGPTRTGCWIIGGGPSLARMPCRAISETPAAKFAVNLGGTSLVRPTLWTSYDPSARFHRSVYLDASILKFVHERRAMDLVPETTFKVCECPGTVFFERDTNRGFSDFLDPANPGVIDWNDSLLQAIDVAYRLGFRILYLAGCDLHVRPSAEQLSRAAAAGVEYSEHETLESFFRRCEEAGCGREELARIGEPQQYHFDERKTLGAAIQTDLHYFRVAQYLRLARRSLALAGMELVSVTPDSRLNDHFEYRTVEDAAAEVRRTAGDPKSESTRGRYSLTSARTPAGTGPMRDYRPHHWKRRGERPVRGGDSKSDGEPAPGRELADAGRGEEVLAEKHRRTRGAVHKALEELPEIPVGLDEVG